MSRCCALLQIDDKIVDSRVVTEFFSCDLSVCHGACCVEGSSGAPLEAGEIEGLGIELPVLLEMLPARNVPALRTGVAYRDGDGEWVTRLVDGCECAFSYNEGGIFLCGIEKAWRGGVIAQTKPKSCSLYPIRVQRMGVMQRLSYHEWEVCAGARKKGQAERIRVYEFLRRPIEQYFGAEFYRQLEAAAAYLEGSGA
jgi:hypothetical protein